MHEVGMACLSPGFSTQDPAMREQLQRSISVRDQQRSIIEARLHRHARPGEEGGSGKDRDDGPASARGERNGSNERPLGSARRRGPPSNLTIVPPPHQAFANERVIQSAPLNQSFTGRHQALRHHHNQHPHHPSNLPPPTSQVNRLPPITDVFGPEKLDGSRSARPDVRPYFPTSRPSYPSPNGLAHNRSRDYVSADEAVHQMAGGREDMLPRIVHYGGHQPPTPPSPPTMAPSTHPHSQHPAKMAPINGHTAATNSSGRRRGRAEYERDGSYGSENEAREPDYKKRKEEDRKKRAQFLDLCAQAWDLLHS